MSIQLPNYDRLERNLQPVVLAFDTETRGFEWYGDQLAFLGQISDDVTDYAYDLDVPEQAQAFWDHLMLADVLLAHNFKFDCHQVRETLGKDLLNYWWGWRRGVVQCFDTELMARVLLPESKFGEHGGFSLSALSKVFLERDIDYLEEAVHEAAKAIGYTSLKDQPGMYYDVYRAYPQVMLDYAKMDTRCTWDLYAYLCTVDATEGQKRVMEVEHKCLPVYIEAEAQGVALDPPAVKKLHQEYKKRERQQRDTLAKYGMPDEALGGKGSEAALEEFLLKQGVPLYKRTDSGDKFSTAKSALEEFKTEHPFVEDFLEYRVTEKFLSTYIEPMLEKHVIHTSFQPIGTWTGRNSCRQPNMQNIPVRGGTEIRNVMVARPGYKFLVVDYDNIEVRILAYYLGPDGQAFRDLINEGLDAHAWMASKLAAAGAPGFAGHSLDMNDYLKGTDGAWLRAKAKNSAMFPIIYGAGGLKLCITNGLPTGPPLKANSWEVRNGIKPEGAPSGALGKELKRAVVAAIPGYKGLMNRIQDAVKARGYVTTYDGRKQVLARDKGYIGMSALVQGSAAGAFKQGIINVADTFMEAEFDARTLLFVHDELVAECREDEAENGLLAMRAAMESVWAPDFDPPLLTSGTIVDTYGEAK